MSIFAKAVRSASKTTAALMLLDNRGLVSRTRMGPLPRLPKTSVKPCSCFQGFKCNNVYDLRDSCVHQDGHAVGIGIGGGEIEAAISIEVTRRDGERIRAHTKVLDDV